MSKLTYCSSCGPQTYHRGVTSWCHTSISKTRDITDEWWSIVNDCEPQTGESIWCILSKYPALKAMMRFSIQAIDMIVHPEYPLQKCNKEHECTQAKESVSETDSMEDLEKEDTQHTRSATPEESEKESKDNKDDMQKLHLPLPPKEIHDGMLFRKVG
ncbi:hypothetical protein K504DRAFT_498860 [Pleomassaria siparia CBS 279.74]|uniref:Uncharacterized protein n=1 Tax=Pleomassaria siparia CBS 279.74 TaxID=1314801 RepID=A0A6G1KNV6_9PLEO|nr:hypothetical protein K504DRAFT_498860 [Pleomassaria siparia CBS 279.74]